MIYTQKNQIEFDMAKDRIIVLEFYIFSKTIPQVNYCLRHIL